MHLPQGMRVSQRVATLPLRSLQLSLTRGVTLAGTGIGTSTQPCHTPSRLLHTTQPQSAPTPMASSTHSPNCACCAPSSNAYARFMTHHGSRGLSHTTVPTFAAASSSPSSSGELMRAAVCVNPGPSHSLQVRELRRPRPKRGEVLIKVRACGACHSDLHVMDGSIPFAAGFPLAVFGHEVTGSVVEFGDGAEEQLLMQNAGRERQVTIGSRVVSPFIMPCGACPECVRGAEELCQTFFKYNRGKGQLYDGSTRLFTPGGEPVAMYSMGGLAEYCVVPATAVFALPDGVPFVDGAILGCAAFTAFGALTNTAKLLPSESVAIIGAAGGIGNQLVALAKALGASTVIAVDKGADKMELCRKRGADHLVDVGELKPSSSSSSIDPVVSRVLELTNGRGVDVSFEAIGLPLTFAQSTSIVRDGGRSVHVGLAKTGLKADVEITRLVRREVSVLGSFGAKTRQDMPRLLQLMERGKFNIDHSVTKRFSLEQAAQAYQLLHQGKIVGRAVIDMEME